MSKKPQLGVCYYPEHWPQDLWISDAENMVKTGIKWVRIAEFAWSRIEKSPDNFDFEWLDKIVDILGKAGLKIVMCAPTATPPKWLVDLRSIKENFFLEKETYLKLIFLS